MTNYDEEWCRQNPGSAAALIAQKDFGWSECSQAFARLQGEARNWQRALSEEQQANDDLRDVLDRVKAERSALEFERDHLVIAVEQAGLQIGSHGAGLGVTEASLTRLKAKAQVEILLRYSALVFDPADKNLLLNGVEVCRRQQREGRAADE